MRIPDYDEWYEKIGSDKFDELLDAMDEFPTQNNNCIKSALKRAIVMIESNEADILMEWYEAYTSKIQDYAYEQMKDEKLNI